MCPVDETEQRKKSLRIDPAFFETFKIQGISVLTDQNADGVRKAIGKAIANNLKLKNLWNFLQDLQKLNSDEFTTIQFKKLIDDYVVNNSLYLDKELKDKIRAELEKPNPNLYVFKEVASKVFDELIKKAEIQDAVKKELGERPVAKTVDTEQAMINSSTGENKKLHAIKTNKELIATPIADMQVQLDEMKIYYENRIIIIGDQMRSHRDDIKMHTDGDMAHMTNELRHLSDQLKRVSTLVEDVQKHQQMFAHFYVQRQHILQDQNSKLQEAGAKLSSVKKISADDVTSHTSPHKKALDDYESSHSGIKDKLNSEKTRIAKAANREIDNLNRKFKDNPTNEQKFEALNSFQIAITKLIEQNKQAVDQHNKSHSVLSRASYGDLDKILTAVIDEKSKLLGDTFAATKEIKKYFDNSSQKKIAELEGKPPQLPMATPANVQATHVRRMAR